jgi:hypothetical protein
MMANNPKPQEPTRSAQPGLAGVTCYALRDTRIETAGVMRCCLATVAEEYEGGDSGQDKPVTIGMKSKCRHCNQTFTLVESKPHPKWKPDWQLGGNTEAHRQPPEAGGEWEGNDGHL